ncbi:hypothetical protein ACEQ8H_002709 [Pleosporales sp. CAS-2024a]
MVNKVPGAVVEYDWPRFQPGRADQYTNEVHDIVVGVALGVDDELAVEVASDLDKDVEVLWREAELDVDELVRTTLELDEEAEVAVGELDIDVEEEVRETELVGYKITVEDGPLLELLLEELNAELEELALLELDEEVEVGMGELDIDVEEEVSEAELVVDEITVDNVLLLLVLLELLLDELEAEVEKPVLLELDEAEEVVIVALLKEVEVEVIVDMVVDEEDVTTTDEDATDGEGDPLGTQPKQVRS